jgi:DNA-binding NtrC family response regulator
MLGISRATLYRKLKRYNIAFSGYEEQHPRWN